MNRSDQGRRLRILPRKIIHHQMNRSINQTISVICPRLHLSLKYMLLAYAVDGLAGSWFTVLLALYSVTADINTGKKSRTLSILSIICLSSVAQAGVSVATSDLISSLGFFYASLLISCIGGVAFVIPLVLMPETLHCK